MGPSAINCLYLNDRIGLSNHSYTWFKQAKIVAEVKEAGREFDKMITTFMSVC